jgi:hypothetical protein
MEMPSSSQTCRSDFCPEPEPYSLTASRRNSGGYGGRGFGMDTPSRAVILPNDRVSAKPVQL